MQDRLTRPASNGMETLKNLSGGQKFIIGLILGLVIGWGGTILALDKKDRIKTGELESKSDSKDESMDESAPMGTSYKKIEAILVSGTNAVEVNDQLAGDKVEVTMVTLSKAGWVVIHEDDNGASGKVLGARRYEPGIYLAEVELLRPTESGKMYYAMLHLDDGDKEFNLGKDAPIKGDDGIVVMDSFKAQ